MENKDLLSVIEISRQLGLPLSRVRSLSRIYANRIPSVIRGGERMYPPEAVDLFRAVLASLQKAQSFGGAEEEAAAAGEEGAEEAIPEERGPGSNGGWAIAGSETPSGGTRPGWGGGEASEAAPDEVYYSIPKISQITDIPESKLLEYRRKHAHRIPSVGRGKDRVHPSSAIPVFQQIHRESTGEQITVREGRRLFDLKELCERLELSRSLVYSYISEEGDRIPKVKEGKRWLFPQEATDIIREIRREREDRKRRKVEGYYSIRDISRITGISESTLHQYKRRAGDAVPSVGRGRDRKYPEDAIAIFRSMRDRGGAAGEDARGYYSLAEVSLRTGIPKHTLLYYRRAYPGEIPLAEGRKNRVYTDESVLAFQRLRERSGRRGRRGAGPEAGSGPRIQALEMRVRLLGEALSRVASAAGVDLGDLLEGLSGDDSEE